VGGFDIDFNPTAERSEMDPTAPDIIYRAGQLNDGAQLDQVALIDSRTTGNVDPAADPHDAPQLRAQGGRACRTPSRPACATGPSRRWR
jgi:hypothetical protein